MEIDPDSLEHIFKYLDFNQRVNLEAVCQLWRWVLMIKIPSINSFVKWDKQVFQRSSAYSDMKHLNIAKYLNSSTSSCYYQQESLSVEPTVLGVVERCGIYVRELSFGGRWIKLSQPIINGIAESKKGKQTFSACLRLRVLDLSAVILNADLAPLLEAIAEQLEAFSIEDTGWVDDVNAQKITTFFPRFWKLKKFNCRSASSKILNQINKISGKLSELDASSVHHMHVDVLNEVLAYQNQLTSLTLSPMPVFDSSIVETLSELSNLKSLSLGYIDHEDTQLDLLGRLNSLTELKLTSVQCLSEISMRVILSHLTSLQSLNICGCKNVFDYSALECCREVTRLMIGDTMQLSNEDIHTICNYGNLQHLKLVKCINITTPAIIHALRRNQLTHTIQLDTSGCIYLTDEVPFAIASTQHRIEFISLAGCMQLTSKGIASLSHLRNVEQLTELDVGKNRKVDEMAILSLHNVLKLKEARQHEGTEEEDDLCQRHSTNNKPATAEKKLIIYALETSVPREVEDKVSDHIQLLF